MLLQNSECEVNAAGQANVTPLHLAAGMDRLNVCKMLVSEVCYNNRSNRRSDKQWVNSNCDIACPVSDESSVFEGGISTPPPSPLKKTPVHLKLLKQ